MHPPLHRLIGILRAISHPPHFLSLFPQSLAPQSKPKHAQSLPLRPYSFYNSPLIRRYFSKRYPSRQLLTPTIMPQFPVKLPRPLPHDPHHTPHHPVNVDNSIQVADSTSPSDCQLALNYAVHNLSSHNLETSAPQCIRVSGFQDLFDRFSDRLNQVSCDFGANKKVACTCDTLRGTVECSVPSTYISPDNVLSVKVCFAEYESAPLTFKYAAKRVRPPNGQRHSEDDTDDNSTEPKSSPSNAHTEFLKKLTRERSRKNPTEKYTLLYQCIAECIGTMFIVIFGVGSVCSAVTLKTNVETWHIASVWGFGVGLAIYSSASISGGHLNPAVSLAQAIFRPNDFPWSKLLPYWFAQYFGGVLGGAFNLMVFGPAFKHMESSQAIMRGSADSTATAQAFGEYFPAPGGLLDKDGVTLSPAFAMMVEAWGTGILMFIILVLTDPRQKFMRNKELIPFLIGFTVAILLDLYSPITQAGWNPARDFGPRLVAAMAGWGRIAIPGPRGGFWVYIIGPKIGAPIGALLYDLLISPGLSD